MEDLCTACLCTGRNLSYISESVTPQFYIYSQILNEIPVYDFSQIRIKICWECKALLTRFHNFKQTVKDSYTELLQHVNQSSLTKVSLAKPSRLQICNEGTFSMPEVTVKRESDDGVEVIKSEMEEYCEPETFVNALDICRLKKKSSLKICNEGTFSVSGGTVERECDDMVGVEVIKPEMEEYCEPETFVNALDICSMKKKSSLKPSRKKDKVKSKKKLKKKKKLLKLIRPPLDFEISDVGTDLDVGDDAEKSNEAINDELTNEKVKEESSEEIILRQMKDGIGQNDDEIPNNVKVTGKRNGVQKKSREELSEKPQCVECGKFFSSKKTYRYHLKVIHKGHNRHPCPRCGKVYQWKSNLGRHLRSHKALDSGELYCEPCDKRFASVATYRQHLRAARVHVAEHQYSFMCNECGKKFVSKTRLRDHIDWEHLKKIKFRCQMCNKPFKSHTSLYVHVHNVHGPRERDNLCHVCGKSYQNPAKLRYHITAMHTGDTPYRCQLCSAAFGWYSSLYRHVREVHHKLKLQPKKTKKSKKLIELLPPMLPPQLVLTQLQQPGPA